MHITRLIAQSFQKKEVQILLKNVYAVILEQDNAGVVHTRGSAVVTGVFEEHDDYYLYLSDQTGTITRAIAIELIASISLSEDDELEEIAKIMGMLPGEDEDVH